MTDAPRDPRARADAESRVPREAAELERHVKVRRKAGGVLLSADAFDRWGPKDDAEQAARIERDATAAAAAASAAERALDAEVPVLRAEHPEAVAAWADAHLALLDEFIARTDDDTARGVASEERQCWERVRAGELDRVDQNTYYVHYDRGLYAELFGFDY